MIVMNHYLFQLDLDWSYPSELFEIMVPIIRVWIKELEGCTEVFFWGLIQIGGYL